MSSPHPTLLTASGFTAILLALGASDALWSAHTFPTPLAANVTTDRNENSGVAKQAGPSVESVFVAQHLSTAQTGEVSLIRRIVPEPQNVKSTVLLRANDRLAFISWIESPSVKKYFNAIKEALHSSFSPQMEGLKDETFTSSDKPTVNFLTFRDPAIAPERIVFLRVRERLFEFHIAEGRDKDVATLLTELSR